MEYDVNVVGNAPALLYVAHADVGTVSPATCASNAFARNSPHILGVL